MVAPEKWEIKEVEEVKEVKEVKERNPHRAIGSATFWVLV
jgi:hypothetical protein